MASVAGDKHPQSKLITINVDGQDVRPRDAWWVVFDPKGEPLQAFTSDAVLRDNLPRAARMAWSGDTAAILALNEGHRIQLMTQKRFLREVAPKLPENN